MLIAGVEFEVSRRQRDVEVSLTDILDCSILILSRGVACEIDRVVDGPLDVVADVFDAVLGEELLPVGLHVAYLTSGCTCDRSDFWADGVRV